MTFVDVRSILVVRCAFARLAQISSTIDLRKFTAVRSYRRYAYSLCNPCHFHHLRNSICSLLQHECFDLWSHVS